MEFGMFHEFPSLPGGARARPSTRRWRRSTPPSSSGSTDVVGRVAFRATPFTACRFAQHCLGYRHPHQPHQIGMAVQVLRFCHPLRLAEEAATVDQLSHGRLIFGVGCSGVVQTYEAYGVSYAESRMAISGRFDTTGEVRILPLW